MVTVRSDGGSPPRVSLAEGLRATDDLAELDFDVDVVCFLPEAFEGVTLDELSLGGVYGAGQRFDGCTFRNGYWRKWELSDTRFERCTFESCTFVKVDLTDSVVRDCRFVDCRFVKASACRSTLRGVSIEGGTYETFWFDRCAFERCRYSGLVPERDRLGTLRPRGKGDRSGRRVADALGLALWEGT